MLPGTIPVFVNLVQPMPYLAIQRLLDVKRAWDPDNVIHHNQNILPA